MRARDQIAVSAMNGMISCCDPSREIDYARIAAAAYLVADAMLLEQSKKPECTLTVNEKMTISYCIGLLDHLPWYRKTLVSLLERTEHEEVD